MVKWGTLFIVLLCCAMVSAETDAITGSFLVMDKQGVTSDATRIVYDEPPELQEPAPTGEDFSLDEGVPEEEFPTLFEEKATADEPLLTEKHQALLDDPEEQAESQRLVDTINNEEPVEMIKQLSKSKMQRFLVQFKRSCDLSGIPEPAVKRRIDTDNYVFMALLMPRALLRPFIENGCVVKIADPENKEAFFEYAKNVMREEAMERALLLELHKSSNDVTAYGDLVGQLDDAWDRAMGKHSPLQQYVTPKAAPVQRLAGALERDALYARASGWLWISDDALWQESEKWLTPAEFLASTPSHDDNPLVGTPASDCSEQANTLVSLLRASGVSPKNVRVAMGEVEFFDGTSGGHAWVEVRIDGTWIVLDPTVGSYYDDETGELAEREGLPVSYWHYHPFPINEVWSYYNDKYFLDMREDHAPKSWDQDADTLLGKELSEGLHQGFWEKLMLLVIRVIGAFA